MSTLKQYLKSYKYQYIASGFKLNKNIEPGVQIEFIQVGYQDNNQAAIDAMDSKGYRMATIAEMFEYFDKHKIQGYCSTVEGDYSATFHRGADERYVNVYRNDHDWSDGWWFGGVRKSSSDTKTLDTLDTLAFSPDEIRKLKALAHLLR